MYLSSTIIISVQALTAANCKNISNEKGCGFFAEVKMDDIVPKMACIAFYMKKVCSFSILEECCLLASRRMGNKCYYINEWSNLLLIA